jgi:UDP-glucose 6-dehydrogenase
VSRIAVIGTGYVGLTTGACFAHLGHEVICADVIAEKIERLKRGDVPILEAGLPELVREGIDGGRLSFVLGAANAAATCEFAYLCVPTPQAADGSADLTYIRAAAAEIGPVLPSEAVVVNKSTVPVGSTRVVEAALGRTDVFVVSNPEFLREGSAVHDFLNPDRIVIGSEHQDAAIRVGELFAQLKAPLLVTDPASAETIKYASNAFLATKVSFINAIAAVCESVGADVREVVLGMGYDKRIGFEFLKPGPGWGGSCFLPDETILVRRKSDVRLLTFAELFAAVEGAGLAGFEVLSWRPGEPAPEFLPMSACTSRPYDGHIIEIRTEMGRRLRVTADHPMLVGDGVDGELRIRPAADLTTSDWVPVAQGASFAEEDAGVWTASAETKATLLGILFGPLGPGARWRTGELLLADAAARLLGDLHVPVAVAGDRDVGFTLTIGNPDAPGPDRGTKNAVWANVTSADPQRYSGSVYSVEVPIAHTVVTSFGLVAHNCFPKDTRALIHIAEMNGYDFDLLRGVIAVNEAQYARVTDKIIEAAGGAAEGAVVAVWGLTFKARTDDLRDSPALEVIRQLSARGAVVRAYDPAVPGPLDGVDVVSDPYAACQDAVVLAVLTEWDEFRWLDLDKVKAAMARACVVDARNLLDPAPLRRRGFDYEGIGRL